LGVKNKNLADKLKDIKGFKLRVKKTCPIWFNSKAITADKFA